MKLVVVIVLTTCAAVADAAQTSRDWTIERPVLAGFLNGLTLGTCGAFEYGSQQRISALTDPFAMSDAVRSNLKRLGQSSYTAGTAAGVASTVFLIGGVFFRRLNTLRLRNTADWVDA